MSTPLSGTKLSPTEFVQRFKCAALDVERQYGVPYLVALGQAAGETGWGAKAPGNNYFGIKAFGNWKGKVQVFQTQEYINGQWVTIYDKFRAYDSAAESFLDYGNYLRNSGLYSKAFAYKNPYSFISEVGKVYATSPVYAQFVGGIMDVIQQAEQTVNVQCGRTSWLGVLALTLGITGLGMATYYNFDTDKMGTDLKKLWK